MSTARHNQDRDPESDFPRRLQELTEEFRSRYALSKASGIAVSTLQAYEAGSKPGLDALVALARTANVSLDWLLTGQGEKRPTGILPGVELTDVIMVDQYQPGTSIIMEMIVGRIPFSRHLLERKRGLEDPSHRTLLAIEATQNLAGIQRGDLVLIDRKQTGLIEDGVYLLNLPALVLKEISVFPNAWVLVTGSETEAEAKGSEKPSRRSLKMRRGELLGDGQFSRSKVVGRAILVFRTLG
jgi:transcriptional regulator with XRE-family HTH domain